mmetsp:Transcript_38930/g.117081  ORF Transcript_38930/g.117081 Transcript_38930/m.117081 type:complete len:247 (-) Transcript_38930:1908-2648(-)
MFSGQFVPGLTEVQRPHPRASPEFMELGRQAEGRPEPIESRGRNFCQGQEEGGKLLAGIETLSADAFPLGRWVGGVVLVGAGCLGSSPIIVGIRPVLVVAPITCPRRQVDHIPVVKPRQQFHGSTAVSHPLRVRMNRDTHDPRTAQPREIRITELLADRPGYQISRGSMSPCQLSLDGFAGNLALEGHLYHRQYVRQTVGILLGARTEEDEHAVGRRVREHLKIVRSILVMGRGVQSHQLLEERFR